MCEDHTEIWNFMQYKDLSFIVSGWFHGIIWVVEGVLIPNQSSTVCPNGLRTTGCFFLVFMVIILIVSYYINIFVFCHWLIYFPTIRQLVYFNIAEFAIISNTAMRVCFFCVCVYTVTPLNYFLEVASWERIYYNLIFFFNGLPWQLSGKESACNAGDLGSIPGLGRSPGEKNGDPFQYSCLENPIDRGAWRATVHRVSGKESACQCRRWGFDPWVGKIPWRRQWQHTPLFLLFLPGKSHGQKRLVGYSPWGHKESDMT